MSAPQVKTATTTDSGRTCPYCRFVLKEGIALATCPVCHADHHAECWADNRGCSMIGCSAGPGAEPPETQQGDGPVNGDTLHLFPPPPMPPGASAAAQPAAFEASPRPQSAAPRRVGPLAVLAVVAVALALGAGTAVAILVTRGHHGSNHAAGRTPVVQASASDTGATTVTSSSTPTAVRPANPGPSPVQSRRAILSLLNSYAAAATSHNVAQLGTLFTSTVTRRGAAYGSASCTTSTGKPLVLAVYRDQFARTSGQYELLGLRPAAIELQGRHAVSRLHYRFVSDGATGAVTFQFGDSNGQWLITHIGAVCTP